MTVFEPYIELLKQAGINDIFPDLDQGIIRCSKSLFLIVPANSLSYELCLNLAEPLPLKIFLEMAGIYSLRVHSVVQGMYLVYLVTGPYQTGTVQDLKESLIYLRNKARDCMLYIEKSKTRQRDIPNGESFTGGINDFVKVSSFENAKASICQHLSDKQVAE